jgi:FlaA1/EpsC-like NDP-sugar epimerase
MSFGTHTRQATMFSGRERALRACLRLLDLAALGLSFPVAYLVRDGLLGERYGRPGLHPIDQYWPVLVATLLLWLGVSAAQRLYRSDRLRNLTNETARVTRTAFLVAAAIAAIGFLTKQGGVSRLFVVLFFVAATALLVGNRLLLRGVLRFLRRKGLSTRIVAVVGTNAVAAEIAAAIQARREWGYHFAGHIETDGEVDARSVGPLIGSLSNLRSILDAAVIDEIIFAVPQTRFAELEAAAQLCFERGAVARVCLHTARDKLSRLSLDELNGLPLLDFY